MKEVYILKEINLLDSGEKEFYVDVYDSLVKAEQDLEKQILERIGQYNSAIEWKIGSEVKIMDTDNNIYKFDKEYKCIK